MKTFENSEEKRLFVEQALLDIREEPGDEALIKELHDCLMQDQEMRTFYLEANQLDAMLHSLPAAEHKTRKTLPFEKSHLFSALVGAGLAAGVAILLSLGNWLQPAKTEVAKSQELEPAFASLEAGFDADLWGSATFAPGAFREGELALNSGIAQLNFRNGAEIVLEGRCGFEILDEFTVALNFGKIWAYCPPEAEGFRVLTPNGGQIVDLGTEFGVEVHPDGRTNVHVFDGRVEVSQGDTFQRELLAGHSMLWGPTPALPQVAQADFEKFITSSTLAQKRLAAYQEKMRKREDLLLYYDFTDTSRQIVRNLALKGPLGSDGRILGGIPVTGRVTGLAGFQLEAEGDGIELNLDFPKGTTSMTTGMWAKIDRFESSLASLLNSSGWEPNDIHFQLRREGYLKSGIHGGDVFRSPSGSVTPGRWHFLVVTWDFESNTALFYCDGKPLYIIEQKPVTPPSETLEPNFGLCRIGSWDGTKIRPEVRDLRGRIDEVLVFDHALSPLEIQELYELGRP